MTHSACEICRALVPAKIVADENGVHFHKFCREHGAQTAFVRSDVEDYLHTLRYVKPAWIPEAYEGDRETACPQGCGFCDRHEQHLCMPIVEMTNRCNLACPICLNASGSTNGEIQAGWDMSLDEFRVILDRIVKAERQIDVLNLSGGEPLLHPCFMEMVDEALSRKEIVRLSVSTNGLCFLDQPGLLRDLRDRNVVVSLQMDGFDDRIYQTLRGRPLLDKKRRILGMLAELDVTTSLTMTAVSGVNDDQFRLMLDTLFDHEHIISLMIQPLAFAGRAADFRGRWNRLTIPDVTRLLGESGHPAVASDDFVPLPCSHPLCFSLAFYLMLDGGGAVSLGRLTDASTLLDAYANRVIFGLDSTEHDKLKDMIYALWSGPAAVAPDSQAVLGTLRALLKELSDSSHSCFDPRSAFTLMERKVKSIFIHAFQDAGTFDLARTRRCCQAYAQPNGRLIPACVRNVLESTRNESIPTHERANDGHSLR